MDLKEYRNKLVGNSDERAVSPVIGVILMVAIVVILAAVIASFVLGMGDELGNTAPTTDVSVSTNSDYDPDSGDDGTDEMVYLSHTTGDSIDVEDLEVVVRDDDGAALANLDANSGSGSFDGADGNLETDLDGDFDAGSTITISYTDVDNPDEIQNGETITVQLVHTPSSTTISDSEVDLPQ